MLAVKFATRDTGVGVVPVGVGVVSVGVGVVSVGVGVVSVGVGVVSVGVGVVSVGVGSLCWRGCSLCWRGCSRRTVPDLVEEPVAAGAAHALSDDLDAGSPLFEWSLID